MSIAAMVLALLAAILAVFAFLVALGHRMSIEED